MKRLLFILCIITSSLIFTSCKTMVVTSADTVISSSWSVTTPAGLSAKLDFETESASACLKITDEQGTESVIEGIYAIDSKNLYITSVKFGKTYCFGYRVYVDRLELTYNDTSLTFSHENITNGNKNKEP